MDEVNKTHTVLRYVYRLQVHRHCVTTKTDQIYDRCQRSLTYMLYVHTQGRSHSFLADKMFQVLTTDISKTYK